MRKATLHTDGGSRGNPGLAGIGFQLCADSGEIIAQGGWSFDRETNNVAEYSALIWGLENALEAGVTHLKVCADSELIVKQIKGEYKVRNEFLKPLYSQVKYLFSQFVDISIMHVYREENAEADALANEAMDIKAPVGTYLKPWGSAQPRLFDDLEDSITMQTNNTLNNKSNDADGMIPKRSVYTGPLQLSGKTYESARGTYELTIKHHFDAAHTLTDYDGPCRFLHGHTWDVEVTVMGASLDKAGLLVDFKEVKQKLHAVLENFDHRYINDVPPFDHISPTAENMARIVCYELNAAFPDSVLVKELAVWESPVAKVVYRPQID